MSNLVVKYLDQTDFATMQDEWQDCLSRSNADPLFMSWQWLFTWWETWSKKIDLSLFLIAVYNDADQLVGIGPFFKRRQRSLIRCNIDRIYYLGNAWRIKPSVRTEYSSLITDNNVTQAAEQAIFSSLQGQPWTELIISDIEASYLTRCRHMLVSAVSFVTEFQRGRDTGIRIDTSGEFEQWLKALGRNTRLRLYNRRHYLERRGLVEEIQISSEDDVRDFFVLLNKFHLKRWAKPCFDQLAIEFHMSLRRRLTRDQQVDYRVIKFNGTVVSVLYDIRAGDRVYNIQSGYRDNFDKKISLGTLHLGYAIESAFNNPDIHTYDLLAGKGRKIFYKERLNGKPIEFYTVQFVRSRLLKMIYIQWSYLPQTLRTYLINIFRL